MSVIPWPRRPALFLDFDGTLVEIAATPDAVVVPQAVKRLLARLSARLGGAVAILTGRRLADLDRRLDPIRLPAAALHGLEWRRDPALEAVHEPESDRMQELKVRLAATRFAAGVLIEDKGRTLAVHFRQAPEAGELVAATVARLLEGADGLAALPGKMVVEIKPHHVSKGTALAHLMAASPFAGRIPVVIGDDVTDEYAFAAAAELGGLAVKVGPGPTIAPHRLDTPQAVLAALAAFAARRAEALA